MSSPGKAGGVVRRPGGRTARNRSAVHEACLRLLAENGVHGLRMEELAERAGVHRTTVHRRWPSLPVLLGDVAAELILTDVPVPDTGSLRGDLIDVAESIAAVIRHPVHGPAMTALFTAPSSMSAVDQVIRTFWEGRLAALGPVVHRAVQRGEVPSGTRAEQLFECLGAPLYYRLLLTRQPVDQDAVSRAVEITLAAAASGVFAGE